MGVRARNRRAFERMWDGNGKWGVSEQRISYHYRIEHKEFRGEQRKPLIKNGGKP